jgi:hypothetical protein
MNRMNLILLIVLLFLLWLVYSLYTAYDNIVKELREIRDKCVKEGVAKEGFNTKLQENPVDSNMKAMPSHMIKGLKLLLNAMA